MALIWIGLFLVLACGASAQLTNLNGPSGNVVSANPYRDLTKQRWIITVEAGKTIELTFAGRFDIENEGSCRYDSLNVYNGAPATTTICPTTGLTGKIGTYCGFTAPSSIVSSGNVLVIDFCSDSSSNGAGFEIAYKLAGAPLPPPSAADCQQLDVTVTGKHTVTYYSEAGLKSFQDCKYHYKSATGSPLKVTATRFGLEGIIGCRYDSVKIYDANTADASKLLGTFCGTNGPKNVRSKGGDVYITFTSDEYTNGKGFSLDIEETCPEQHICALKSTAGADVCYTEAETCDGTAKCVDGQDESGCKEDCGFYSDWAAGQPFPGAAAITNIDGQIHCGGALINNQYVLTAAHCFNRLDKRVDWFVVKVGAARLPDAHVAQIEEITIHPNWNPKTLAHNLAIIKLKAPIPIQKSISPFCLPIASDVANPADSAVCYTLGWGRTAATNINSYATTVKQFTATISNNAACKSTISSLGSPVTIDNTVVCARTSGNLCFGDNGAPLVCKGANGKWAVTGINSIAYSCTGQSTTPAAFTKVSHAQYSEWILKTAFGK